MIAKLFDTTEIKGNGHLSLNSIPFQAEPAVQPWYRRGWFHLLLFFITFTVVYTTGATTILNQPISGTWNWITGAQFSLSLMAILTAHEFGHYFAARYHGLDVTLPYFLPGILIPPILNPGTTIMPGTFGAFIRIKTPIRNRIQLMDVGAAGPIAGFVVCLFVLAYGFSTLPPKEYAYQFYDPESIYNGEPTIVFGGSLLFNWMANAWGGGQMPAMYDIVHYPFLFAGWFGLLITAINLLPIGQFDGGHIIYALLGRHQKYFGAAAFVAILALSWWFNVVSWILWAILVLVLVKIKHPPVMDEETELPSERRWVGLVCIIMFIVSFIPAPLYQETFTR